MRAMPVLETKRLRIRPFSPDDLDDYMRHVTAIGWVDEKQTADQQRQTARRYLQWGVLNHEQLAALGQPPYGDRAVERYNGTFVGTCGLVPYAATLTRFPYFGGLPDGPAQTEMGLMWTISPQHQRQGYATEVGRALIDYAFGPEQLSRLIATTEYDNAASIAVMGKLGMRVETNSFRDPPWLQVLGIIENPRFSSID